MTDGAIGEMASPEASLGTASDVSPSHPSSKDEGVSSDIYFLLLLYRHLNFTI